MTTRPKYDSVYKCEQRVLRLTKICLIIQGDLCLEKALNAISAVCLQKFVYITWSHDQFCLQKPWHELCWAIYALNWLLRRIIAKTAVCLQNFVYITWSHDHFCLQKLWQELYKTIYAFKRLTRRFLGKMTKLQQYNNNTI